MEVVYTSELISPLNKNDDIIGIYGEISDLLSFGLDIEGIIYDDDWTVKRLLNGYRLRLNKRIISVFNYIDLDIEYLNVKIKDLSHTTFKYVLLAYLLLNNKKILIFDYFDVGVTYQEHKKIIKIIRNLKRDGFKILFISHDLIFLNQFCDSFIKFNNGKIEFNDKMNKLFTKNKSVVEEPEIIEFIRYANKKGAKLDFTLDSKELLKDIYRSVN